MQEQAISARTEAEAKLKAAQIVLSRAEGSKKKTWDLSEYFKILPAGGM